MLVHTKKLMQWRPMSPTQLNDIRTWSHHFVNHSFPCSEAVKLKHECKVLWMTILLEIGNGSVGYLQLQEKHQLKWQQSSWPSPCWAAFYAHLIVDPLEEKELSLFKGTHQQMSCQHLSWSGFPVIVRLPSNLFSWLPWEQNCRKLLSNWSKPFAWQHRLKQQVTLLCLTAMLSLFLFLTLQAANKPAARDTPPEQQMGEKLSPREC